MMVRLDTEQGTETSCCTQDSQRQPSRRRGCALTRESRVGKVREGTGRGQGYRRRRQDTQR